MTKARRKYQELLGRFAETPEYKAYNLVSDVIDAICEHMENGGVSRSELARRLDVTPQYVTNFLNGTENTSVLQLVKFADALGLEVKLRIQGRQRAAFRWDSGIRRHVSFKEFDVDALEAVSRDGVTNPDERGEAAA